jgi:uncharacterized protein (DUF58 family)
MFSFLPIPDKNTFYLLAGLAVIGFITIFWPGMIPFWKVSALLLLLILLFDILISFILTKPSQLIEIKRDLPGSIPLGVSRHVDLRIHNHSNKSLVLEIFDHFPKEIQSEGLPIKLNVQKQLYADFKYKIIANKRGKLIFPKVQVKLQSVLKLWRRSIDFPVQSETNVYPNFAAISHYALLATDNNLSQLGIIKKRRRGEGQDFHQLREYREGDALRQIDWKATSRIQKLISREYQDERDQEIIFMLDCGHRMMAKDDELSHFDHTLNALLLLSYVALRQGDAVGLSTFSGDENRWISPRKGQHTVQNILNTVYDLQPSSTSPDYSKAATDLLIRHKKRALVIILTNTRDEDSDDLLPAIKLLKKRHLVLLASLREASIENTLNKAIEDHQDALNNAATQHYLQQRKITFEQLISSGINTIDVSPEKLTVELINTYLGIKSSGTL